MIVCFRNEQKNFDSKNFNHYDYEQQQKQFNLQQKLRATTTSDKENFIDNFGKKFKNNKNENKIKVKKNFN